MPHIRWLALLLIAPAVFSAPARSEEGPIRIGVLTDESGVFADGAGLGSVEAARLAVQDAGGAVLGRPVEVVDADTQNRPDLAVGIARRWFDVDRVGMIVDLPGSPVAIAVQQLAEQRRRSVMVTGAASSALTSQFCGPVSTHWADDTHALAAVTAGVMTQAGARSWFFITVDLQIGLAVEREASETVRSRKGRVVGRLQYRSGASDLSALLQFAQASGAQVIGLIGDGDDMVNLIKQADDVGIPHDGAPALAAFGVGIQDIQSVGLAAARGLTLTSGFYWDQNAVARGFARRFFARRRTMPSKDHALVYTAVRQYLAAVAAAGSEDAIAVNRAMRATAFDFFGKPARIREDGRVMYDETLWRVKNPGESSGPWDDYALVRTIPASEAFLSIAKECGP